jgi:hypothetical protein
MSLECRFCPIAIMMRRLGVTSERELAAESGKDSLAVSP